MCSGYESKVLSIKVVCSGHQLEPDQPQLTDLPTGFGGTPFIHLTEFAVNMCTRTSSSRKQSSRFFAHIVVELVAHLRFRRSRPPGTGAEVLFAERAVGAVLEEARAPRHRRLDDLVSDHRQNVTGHRSVHS